MSIPPQLIDHLKKTEMAKEAERLLDGTGWLPEPLRVAGSEPAVTEPASEVEALPDFLVDENEEPTTANPEEPLRQAIAAVARISEVVSASSQSQSAHASNARYVPSPVISGERTVPTRGHPVCCRIQEIRACPCSSTTTKTVAIGCSSAFHVSSAL